MLYYFLYPLKDVWFGFNLFKYITFRAAMASFTAFLISVILGPIIIRWLAKMNFGQIIRKDHVQELHKLHVHKEGTPTMGGILILLAVVGSTLIWARLDNKFIIIGLVGILWLGLVGFIDDFLKISNQHNKGLKSRAKFLGQVIIAFLIGLYLYNDPQMSSTLYFPFFKNAVLNLGIFYILFVVLVIVGSSNAVNLTDGLDGLAIGCVTIVALAFAIISYITGNINMSEYLNVYYLFGSGELTVLCSSIVGAGLGFLWFNCHPASVFMGDTGSLSLGGVIGIISVLIKKELLLFFVGGIFVAEALSVIIQVASCKLRKGKRVFRMAPIHHHFQLQGWHESKVIIRFWIIAIILVLLSLASLKMR
ncbi:MAG: phospho-N-acetylmuramoyl-pentapeptide-transferase [Candidatus Omnitrophica bacterium]|nr:phospho-N-acetylmuramoyl-pentapeptide-transferase [Candidatus Omnitrophota bacterium]